MLVLAAGLTGSVLVGFTAISQAALPAEPCMIAGPDIEDSDETDGSVITFSVTCHAAEEITDEITVETDDNLIFKASDRLDADGRITLDKAVHLPAPIPPDARICVKVNDNEVCVETDDDGDGSGLVTDLLELLEEVVDDAGDLP